MNLASKRVLLPFRQLQIRICLASLVLLVSAAPASAGSRDAVKKALAATVAVEWRADKKAEQPAPATTGADVQAPLSEGQATNAQTELRDTLIARSRVVRLYEARRSELSLSSGVLLSADGTIATFSREDGKGRYTVYLSDGSSFPTSILVDDRRTGLRLLKIDARELPHLVPAEAEAEVGDHVFAAFSTDRHERAAAQGMISARLRGAVWANSVQVDLTAGPMSTGGPIVDGEGRLVGLLAGKSASGDQFHAGTVATPLDAVRALLKARQGENTVVVQRGLLGISLNSKSDDEPNQVVVHVLEGSPAEAAGVRDGDELVAIDGHKVASPTEAAALVARHALGEKVSVTLRRDGGEREMEITIGRPTPDSPPANAAAPPANQAAPGARVVHPEQLYVLSPDGQRIAVRVDEQQLKALRQQARLRVDLRGDQTATVAEPVPSVIRVERSDLEKKLEEFGRNVEALQKQVQSLTEEIKSLRGKLVEQK
jgi:serine protease Do